MNNRTIKLYLFKVIMLIISCENYIFFDINTDKDNFIVYLTLYDHYKSKFMTLLLKMRDESVFNLKSISDILFLIEQI